MRYYTFSHRPCAILTDGPSDCDHDHQHRGHGGDRREQQELPSRGTWPIRGGRMSKLSQTAFLAQQPLRSMQGAKHPRLHPILQTLARCCPPTQRRFCLACPRSTQKQARSCFCSRRTGTRIGAHARTHERTIYVLLLPPMRRKAAHALYIISGIASVLARGAFCRL